MPQDEDQIGTHLGQIQREEALFGFEVTELEHEHGLHGTVGKGLHGRSRWGSA